MLVVVPPTIHSVRPKVVHVRGLFGARDEHAQLLLVKELDPLGVDHLVEAFLKRRALLANLQGLKEGRNNINLLANLQGLKKGRNNINLLANLQRSKKRRNKKCNRRLNTYEERVRFVKLESESAQGQSPS